MNISLRLRYNSKKVLTDGQTLGIYQGRAGLQPCSPPTSPQLLAASLSLILQPSPVCISRAKQETYSTGKRHWCKGSSTDKAVLLLVLLILPGKDGGCCNKLSCQKRSFARTSYFQPSTQDCCAAVGGGYSCISRLLLMETELETCFPHGKRLSRGQLVCCFTSSCFRAQSSRGAHHPAIFWWSWQTQFILKRPYACTDMDFRHCMKQRVRGEMYLPTG